MIKLSNRLLEIYNNLPCCEVFSDIACDHGYLTYQMLKDNKCKRAIFSDISFKCLQKAQTLMQPFVEQGLAEGVVSDGFDNVKNSDLSLIAGLGGEEICLILNKAKSLPNTLVLQPMKNAPKVRELLHKLNYYIEKDYTFYAEKEFYDLIVASKNLSNNQILTEDMLLFGKTNVEKRPKAFIDKITLEKQNIEKYLLSEKMNDVSKEQLKNRLRRLEKYV